MTTEEIKRIPMRERLLESVRILGRMARGEAKPGEELFVHLTLQELIQKEP